VPDADAGDHGSPTPTGPGASRAVSTAPSSREGRGLDALFVNIALPVGIMVVFVYVFGGAITTGSSGLAYVDFVVPAVLPLSAGYGAALTASTLPPTCTGA
jgi:ABC-2 type transport system permease protein